MHREQAAPEGRAPVGRDGLIGAERPRRQAQTRDQRGRITEHRDPGRRLLHLTEHDDVGRRCRCRLGRIARRSGGVATGARTGITSGDAPGARAEASPTGGSAATGCAPVRTNRSNSSCAAWKSIEAGSSGPSAETTSSRAATIAPAGNSARDRRRCCGGSWRTGCSTNRYDSAGERDREGQDQGESCPRAQTGRLLEPQDDGPVDQVGTVGEHAEADGGPDGEHSADRPSLGQRRHDDHGGQSGVQHEPAPVQPGVGRAGGRPHPPQPHERRHAGGGQPGRGTGRLRTRPGPPRGQEHPDHQLGQPGVGTEVQPVDRSTRLVQHGRKRRRHKRDQGNGGQQEPASRHGEQGDEDRREEEVELLLDRQRPHVSQR